MSEKKYPCLYGLKAQCEARKFVEENTQPPQTPVMPSTPESKAVEKALSNTKVLQFDDKETAKEMGKAAAEGVLGVMSKSLAESMAPLKPQFMIPYCSMCPTRIKECKGTKES